jgi:phenylacetate-CoA ligase
VRGEVTLSGGFNPYLPLLRYRTGDWARLDLSDARQPRLLDLEGRAPVVFRTPAGLAVNNIDVTAAFKPLALPQFTLHQAADGRLTLCLPAPHLTDERPRASLQQVFGPDQSFVVQPLEPNAIGKVVQYSSEAAFP